MGAKQTWTGQHFLFYVACLMIWTLLAVGCLHWPFQPQGEKQLLEARQQFAAGDYRSALEINHRVMTQFPSRLADQSLFQIGLVYAHPDNPQRDIQKALDCFQGIIDRYPASHLRPDAELWLAVLGQLRAQTDQIRILIRQRAPLEKTVRIQKIKIGQLQDQLEKLKRIDIRMEEKKREIIPQAEDIEEKANGKNSDRR